MTRHEESQRIPNPVDEDLRGMNCRIPDLTDRVEDWLHGFRHRGIGFVDAFIEHAGKLGGVLNRTQIGLGLMIQSPVYRGALTPS